MIYKSNMMDVLSNLQLNLLNPKAQDRLERRIATSLYASNINRINRQGLAVNMSRIGTYSTRPIYVNPARSPKKFAPKTPHKRNPKTRYFGGGYKEFRSFIGRENSFINLDLSHRLTNDFRMIPEQGGWVIGFATAYGKNLSLGHEKRLGRDIWGITTKDQQDINNIANSFINDLQKKHAKP